MRHVLKTLIAPVSNYNPKKYKLYLIRILVLYTIIIITLQWARVFMYRQRA